VTDKEILKPLVDKVLELSSRQREQYKKDLWARFNALQPVDKIPVCVTFEGIPAPQWDLMFGVNHLRCKGSLARQLEFDLKKRTWAAAHIPDDHVLWPAVFVPAAAPAYDWGVPIQWHSSSDPLGAKGIVPPFAEKIDLSRLRLPVTQIDEDATRFRVTELTELVGGRLPVHPRYPRLTDAPFDIAVEMRGLENTLLDVYDAPDLLHGLLDFITTAIIADHKHREQCGWINAPADPTGKYQMIPIWRHIGAALPEGFAQRKKELADEWAYVSAQTSSGLGPDMYEKFVNVYNSRIAALYTNKTVYYHGCECLDQKLDSVATLPNLRRHHVSPWSSAKLAAQKFQGRVVLEVHVHPTEVIFNASPEQMREEVARRIQEAPGHPMSLNLSDVHSLAGNPATLKFWAQAAQDVVEAQVPESHE
jgi:hypothetical protein